MMRVNVIGRSFYRLPKQAFFAKPYIDTNTNDDSFFRYHAEPNGDGFMHHHVLPR